MFSVADGITSSRASGTRNDTAPNLSDVGSATVPTLFEIRQVQWPALRSFRIGNDRTRVNVINTFVLVLKNEIPDGYCSSARRGGDPSFYSGSAAGI